MAKITNRKLEWVVAILRSAGFEDKLIDFVLQKGRQAISNHLYKTQEIPAQHIITTPLLTESPTRETAIPDFSIDSTTESVQNIKEEYDNLKTQMIEMRFSMDDKDKKIQELEDEIAFLKDRNKMLKDYFNHSVAKKRGLPFASANTVFTDSSNFEKESGAVFKELLESCGLNPKDFPFMR